jgi:thymidylate synthase (FAD)
MAKMEVSLLDTMGSDDGVANAARVSFAKDATNFTDEQNDKLIKYLAKHNHWSPFAHTSLQFRIKAPIFVARQLGKHQVGLVWNEVSRRYVDFEPEFYMPPTLRLKAANVKQGSSEDTLGLDDWRYMEAEFIVKSCKSLYNQLLNADVCAEQARMFLPQNMMTEWIWTGSLMAFARVCQLRLDSHTQYETRLIAQDIDKEIKNCGLFDVSWEALNEK